MTSQPDKGLLLLLDEPASNLHATAQAQLLGSLSRSAENCSLIYTTHSQHLISPDWLENTYVVRNLGLELGEEMATAQKTDIAIDRYRTFASAHPDQEQYFQPILDVLDYKPSVLEMVPELVLVEGKNDFYALRWLDTVAGIGHSQPYFGPGTGAGSLEQTIRLYISWARNFVVLLDSESEGLKQRRRYVELFGTIVENRIVSLSDLAPDLKGKSLESAFDATDRKTIQDTIFPGEKYAKKQFNRALQEALASSNKVKLTSDTKDRSEKTIDGLTALLDKNR